jgi:predicted nucleic acid-binding protein
MRLYLDTAPTIYLIEGTVGPRDAVRRRIQGTRGGVDLLVTSELTRLECRVHPMASSDDERLGLYDAFFASREVVVIVPDRRAWETATRIRATYGFRVPDALHLACALESACEVFVTNDARLARCREIAVDVVG